MALKKILLYFILITVCLLTASILLLTKLEITSLSFDSYEDVINSDIIKAGWIPNWLPSSAANIKESHDIDTNEIWLTFRFSKKDDFYAITCVPKIKKEIIMPNDKQISVFPEFVSNIYNQLQNNKSLTFYICDESSTWYMAIDHKLSIAYIWQLSQ